MKSESSTPHRSLFLPCALAVLLALLGVFFGMCCIGGLLGESFTYVDGFVVDESGDPIEDALVSLEVSRAERNVDKDATESGSDGAFLIGCTEGGYLLGTSTVVLTVEKDGYERYVEHVPYGKYLSGQRITLKKSATRGREDAQSDP